jgi:hypothetical protein
MRQRQMPSRPHKIRETGLLLAAVCALAPCLVGLAGCAHKKVLAAAPVLTPPSPDVRPMTIAPDTDASPPLEAAAVAPDVPTSNVAPPVDLGPAKTAPPPRRTPAPAASSEANADADAAAHPPAPRIAPQLSPSDRHAFQLRVNEEAAVARKNLQSTGGRPLNAAQQDLADKIRGFLDQSRDAGKDGDWARAENLAQKARLLSVELINSL